MDHNDVKIRSESLLFFFRDVEYFMKLELLHNEKEKLILTSCPKLLKVKEDHVGRANVSFY